MISPKQILGLKYYLVGTVELKLKKVAYFVAAISFEVLTSFENLIRLTLCKGCIRVIAKIGFQFLLRVELQIIPIRKFFTFVVLSGNSFIQIWIKFQ